MRNVNQCLCYGVFDKQRETCRERQKERGRQKHNKTEQTDKNRKTQSQREYMQFLRKNKYMYFLRKTNTGERHIFSDARWDSSQRALPSSSPV